jgi:hypothetical protein
MTHFGYLFFKNCPMIYKKFNLNKVWLARDNNNVKETMKKTMKYDDNTKFMLRK